MSGLAFNATIYTGCKGGCKGCALSMDERKNNELDYSVDFLKSSLENYLRLNHPEEMDYFALVLGRGNILEVDSAVDLISELREHVKSNVLARDKVIEVSTSLLGSYDAQIRVARQICMDSVKDELEHGIEVRFIVVFDLSKKNPVYRENVINFLQTIRSIRKESGLDNTDDTLQIIMQPKETLSPLELLDYFSFHRGAFNLAWGMFEQVEQEQLLFKQAWVEDFCKLAAGKIDLNVNNVLDEIKSFGGHDNTLSNKRGTVFLESDGVKFGDFTPFGDFDNKRLLNYDPSFLLLESAQKIELKMHKKDRRCISCEKFDNCVNSGSYKVAHYNRVKNPSSKNVACPSLMVNLL